MDQFSIIKDAWKRIYEGKGTQEQAAMEAWIEKMMEQEPGKPRWYYVEKYRNMIDTPITHKSKREREREWKESRYIKNPTGAVTGIY